MAKRHLIQSMFHRRLLLLLAAFAVACGGMTAQLAKLTLVEGEQRRAEAESRLVRFSWTPTVRGRILDRKGRVLALDRPSYEVQFRYDVLTGDWALEQARSYARRAHRDRWADLPTEARQELVNRYEAVYRRHLDTMWRVLADQAQIPLEEVLATRDGVVRRVEAMHAHVAERRYIEGMKERTRTGRPPSPSEVEVIRRRAGAPLAEQTAWHTIVSGVGDDVGFRLMRAVTAEVPVHTGFRVPGADLEVALSETVEQFPTMRVENAVERVRPFERVTVDLDLSAFPAPLRRDGHASFETRGVAWHVLGQMRGRVYAEDADARRKALEASEDLRERSITDGGTDRGRYFDEDSVGTSGIEASREHELRGLRGLRVEQINTGEVREVPPEPGRDVRLTLDVMLQARVEAIMDPALGFMRVQEWHDANATEDQEPGNLPVGSPLNGAAVVLDVDTGEILAVVSTPGAPGEEGLYGEGGEEDRLFRQINQPHINRAIAKPYPPGSISKVVVLNAAVLSGHYALGSGIVDTGHLLPGRTDMYRDWFYKRYGLTRSPNGEPVKAAEALMWSNNTFFYTLGQRMGPERTADAYRMFGVGEAFGLGIGPEWPGGFTIDGSEPKGLTIGNAILMGIGQGPVTWTPLHAANAYATIARAGVWLQPRLVDDPELRQDARDLRLNRAAVEETIRGLDLAVNNADGTGHSINYGEPWGRENVFTVPGVEVWGKTGTATAPHLMVDPDGDGPARAEVVMRGDHAWYVVAVGPEGEGARYVISVVVDYGGSGGKVAGPVTNQIVKALVDEGYLPDVRGEESPGSPRLQTAGGR